MNYRRPELYEPLAAEYVLGTLRGGARARMEKLLRREPALAAAVRGWENRLWPFAREVAGVEPGAGLWQAIERRIAPSASRVRPRGLWPWAAGAALASVLAAMMVLFGDIGRDEPGGRPSIATAAYTAMLGPATAKSYWWVRADPASGELLVTVLSKPDMPVGMDCQLWLLRGEGEAPLSLGVLPVKGHMRVPLPHADQFARGTMLAASWEPIGGSQTGTPGRVMFTAQLRSTAS
ncbi:MAG: anti-sigma factor [Nevskiales bacterium]